MHAPALVVGDDLVQKTVGGAAQRTAGIPALHLERMVLKPQALHRRVGRYGVDALFAARTKQLQRGVMCILGLSNLGMGDGAIT